MVRSRGLIGKDGEAGDQGSSYETPRQLEGTGRCLICEADFRGVMREDMVID